MPAIQMCIPGLPTFPATHMKIQTPIHLTCLVSQMGALPSFPNTPSYMYILFESLTLKDLEIKVRHHGCQYHTTNDSEHQLGKNALSNISTKVLTSSNPTVLITQP